MNRTDATHATDTTHRCDECVTLDDDTPLTPTEIGAYLTGRVDAEDDARVAAFGAIRRAAAVARHHDHEARIIECGSTDFAQRLAAEHFCLGRAVRRAIRAAIGSDKS